MADHEWPPEQRQRAVNALAELLLWKLAKNRAAAASAVATNAPVPANDTTPPRAAVGSRRKR